MMQTNLDAEAVFNAILQRRSMGLSRLKDDAVPRELIEQMLEAANWAPSHGDTEPWRFTVFMGEGRAALAQIFGRAMKEPESARKRAFAAPVWISIGMAPARRADGSLKMSVEEELMAVACAVQNLHLMAHALGLTGMWHSKGPSVDLAVAGGLGLDAPDRLLGFFMCGWPAGEWLSSERGPLAEKVRWVEEAADFNG